MPRRSKASSNGSVIDRPKATESGGGNVFADIILAQIAGVADDFEPFLGRGRLRDGQLRAFWPTESHFASALATICARDASYSYQLVGGSRTVRATQSILENANEGEGWHDLMLKTGQDMGTVDNGAFWETVREPDRPTGALVAINHLDSMKCKHTGDPRAPVIYTDRYGKPHLLEWWQVVTFNLFPSPVEGMYGRGMCTLSRVLKAAQILRDIMTLQGEKAGGRHTKALHLVKGVPTSFLKDALTQAQIEMDARGMLRFSTIPIVGIPEPEGTLQTATLALASLPENWSEADAMKWYYILLALGFLADPQELAPIQGGSLGSGMQSETLHLKGQAKGAALFRKVISHALNQKILPKNVEYSYDVQDVEADMADATLVRTRGEGYEILKRAANLPDAIIRQMALDDQVLSQENFDLLGEMDLTDEETVQDADKPDAPDDELLPDDQKPDDKQPPTGEKAGGVTASPFERDAEAKYAARVLKGLRKIRLNVIRELPLLTRAATKQAILRSTDSILIGSKISQEELFWRQQKAIMLKALGKAPQQLIAQGVTQAVGVEPSFTLVNETVLQTAQNYIDPWWEEIETATRDMLRTAITRNIESGDPLKDLIASLDPVFGPGRADTIATTEVTRLFTEGNVIAYNAAGVTLVDFRTVNDGLVDRNKNDTPCIDAEAANPHLLADAPRPPLHPNCRCFLVPRDTHVVDAQVKAIHDNAEIQDAQITPTIKAIADKSGMEMVGLDFRIKSEKSILSKLKRKGDPSRVNDALRYTATEPPKNYAKKSAAFIERLQEEGFIIDLANSDNHWENNPSYHGLNTVVIAPDGFRYELQFHTPDSFATKEANHKLYDKQRELPQGSAEWLRLDEQMRRAWDTVETPPGISDLLPK